MQRFINEVVLVNEFIKIVCFEVNAYLHTSSTKKYTLSSLFMKGGVVEPSVKTEKGNMNHFK